MRLPILAAALAAVAAVPAHAAVYPVCATHVENAAAGTSRTCTTGNNPFAPAQRQMRVVVANGVVDATLRCGNVTITIRVGVGKVGTASATEWGGYCYHTLTAVTSGATAAVVSTFVPLPVQS